jgi:hypothetical protein
MDTIRVKALDPGVRAMMDDFVKSDGQKYLALRVIDVLILT